MSFIDGWSTAVRIVVFALIWLGFVVVATYAAIGMFVALAPADLCGPGLSCSKGPSPAALFAEHAAIALVSFAAATFGFLTVHGLRSRHGSPAAEPSVDPAPARPVRPVARRVVELPDRDPQPSDVPTSRDRVVT